MRAERRRGRAHATAGCRRKRQSARISGADSAGRQCLPGLSRLYSVAMTLSSSGRGCGGVRAFPAGACKIVHLIRHAQGTACGARGAGGATRALAQARTTRRWRRRARRWSTRAGRGLTRGRGRRMLCCAARRLWLSLHDGPYASAWWHADGCRAVQCRATAPRVPARKLDFVSQAKRARRGAGARRGRGPAGCRARGGDPRLAAVANYTDGDARV